MADVVLSTGAATGSTVKCKCMSLRLNKGKHELTEVELGIRWPRLTFTSFCTVEPAVLSVASASASAIVEPGTTRSTATDLT